VITFSATSRMTGDYNDPASWARARRLGIPTGPVDSFADKDC